MKTKFISMESTNLMFQAPTYTRHEGSRGTKLTLGGKKKQHQCKKSNNTNTKNSNNKWLGYKVLDHQRKKGSSTNARKTITPTQEEE